MRVPGVLTGGHEVAFPCVGEAEPGVDDGAFSSAGVAECTECGCEIATGLVPSTQAEIGCSGQGGGHGVVEPVRPARFRRTRAGAANA